MHFLDIDEHFPRSTLLQLLLQLVDLRALAPDDDSRTRGAYDDAQLVPRTLDLHRADARGFELVLELFLELDVFEKQLVVVALYKPARPPGLGIAEAKSVWMDLLSHSVLIADVSSATPLKVLAVFGSWYLVVGAWRAFGSCQVPRTNYQLPAATSRRLSYASPPAFSSP